MPRRYVRHSSAGPREFGGKWFDKLTTRWFDRLTTGRRWVKHRRGWRRKQRKRKLPNFNNVTTPAFFRNINFNIDANNINSRNSFGNFNDGISASRSDIFNYLNNNHD